MKVYPDRVITTSQRSQIVSEVTPNLIANATSNYQERPDFAVLIDNKYLLEGVTDIDITRSKQTVSNICYITLENLDNRYTGINEGKLTTNLEVSVFFGFNAEYYQKFAGYIDEVNPTTSTKEAKIKLTCRDKTKPLIDRTITTATYDSAYLGEDEWHSDGNGTGYNWTVTDIAKDVCLLLGLEENTGFLVEDIRTSCQNAMGMSCADCKEVFNNCSAVFQTTQTSTAPLLTNTTAPVCMYSGAAACKYCKPAPCMIKDVCEFYSFKELPEGYEVEDLDSRRGCKWELTTNFLDESPLDILAQLAQTLMWECYCDFQGRIVLRPPKTIEDKVAFYFKEERDLKSIAKTKTDDFLINNVQVIGYTQNETRVTYPFQPTSIKEGLELTKGQSLHGYKLGYPDCVSQENLETLENYLVTTTLIEPRDKVYHSLQDNPENHPWFDICAHVPNYANPFEKDLVFEGIATCGTTKHGNKSRTWFFYDEKKVEGSKIYLSNPVYVKEEGANVTVSSSIMRGCILPDLSYYEEQIASPSTSVDRTLCCFRTYDVNSNSSSLMTVRTGDGGFGTLLTGVQKYVERYECTALVYTDDYRVKKVIEDWELVQTDTEGSDIADRAVNTDKNMGGTDNIYQQGTEYIDSDKDEVVKIVYYAVLETYLVNGATPSEKDQNIIDNWNKEIKKDDNYSSFYYTSTSRSTSSKNTAYFAFDPYTKTKTSISEMAFEIGSGEPESVVVSCNSGGDLGSVIFRDITDSYITIEGVNDADDLADEFFWFALIMGAATKLAGDQVYVGSFGFVVPNGPAAYAIILANAFLYRYIGSLLTEGDPIEFGCRVWARRIEEILLRANMANNSDGWLNNPTIGSEYDDESEKDRKAIVFTKPFYATVPIRQIGYKPPYEEERDIITRFQIVGWTEDIYTGETFDEVLVDYSATDITYNELGYWWDFYQRRDDFRLRNYRNIKIVFTKLYDKTNGVDLFDELLLDLSKAHDAFFDHESQFKDKCFFVPDMIVHTSDVDAMAERWENTHSTGIEYPEDYIKEVGRELFSAHDISTSQSLAIMDIENWLTGNPIEVDIRVWAKAYGKYAPTLVVEKVQDKHSTFQYNNRNIEIYNPLIANEEIASDIANKIINSAKGELDVYTWESLGKLYLMESQIVTVKEETLGLKSGIRKVWESSYEMTRPTRSKPAMETSANVIMVNSVNEPDGDEIVEVDQNSNVVWRCNNLTLVKDVKRLSYQGNTLIVDSGAKKVVEVDYWDANKTIWEYEITDGIPISADREEDVTVIGVVGFDIRGYFLILDTNSKQLLARIETVQRPETVQVILPTVFDEVLRKDVIDYANIRVLVADPDAKRVSIFHRDGREIWTYTEDLTTPMSAQLLDTGDVLICDAGRPAPEEGSNLPQIAPRILQVNMKQKLTWLVDYTLNPDPWYTVENVCSFFRPVHAYKDLQNNVIVTETSNRSVYKMKALSSFYTTEVKDTFSRRQDKDEYYTTFKAVPIEQSAFLQLTSFGKNFIDDKTSKTVKSNTAIAIAKITKSLGAERYLVVCLGSEDEELQVSNATIESFRVNDTVLLGFEYGNNHTRSIVGRKLANFPNMEQGNTVVTTKDPTFLDMVSTGTTTSVDLSTVQSQINSLKSRVAKIESRFI